MAGLTDIIKRTTGFILAGGNSRRFGSDKRMHRIGSATLIDRTINILTQLLGCHPFVVGDNLDGFHFENKYLLNDAEKNRGPLGGLVSVLENCPTEFALVLAVDLPNINVEDLEYLLINADESFDVSSLSHNDMPEPLVALYNTESAGFWREKLETGSLSISANLNQLRIKLISPPGGIKSLLNINNLEDL